MNRQEFDKWANEMIKRVDYKRIMTFVLPPKDHCKNVVMCYDKRTNKVGIARCHPNDEFNLIWGKAIATARCLGIEVPKITVTKYLSEMKPGEKFLDILDNEFCFIAKHPTAIGRYIVLREKDDCAYVFLNAYYEMVE